MPKNQKPQKTKKSQKLDVVPYAEVVKAPYSNDAIERDDFPGFKEDYLVIHSLLSKYRPKRLAEIGTSSGMGTKVICNAMGVKRGLLGRLKNIATEVKVFSIDVPPNTNPEELYPDKEDGHPARAGQYNTYPYTQLFGFSISYDFSSIYPIEAWFIDGKHNYEYASKDTLQALKSKPRLLIWHDVQMREVEEAILDIMAKHPEYTLHRVGDTRVAYAVL